MTEITAQIKGSDSKGNASTTVNVYGEQKAVTAFVNKIADWKEHDKEKYDVAMEAMTKEVLAGKRIGADTFNLKGEGGMEDVVNKAVAPIEKERMEKLQKNVNKADYPNAPAQNVDTSKSAQLNSGAAYAAGINQSAGREV